MSNEEIVLRLCAALFFGMIIGFERIFMKHEAGVRTHGLVSMGSALFIITGIIASINLSVNQTETIRILGQIVTGIGFLGAGLIFTSEKEHRKKGLTSAATLWATSAIGATCGFGLIGIAFLATILTLFTLTLMASFEWFMLKFFGRDR